MRRFRRKTLGTIYVEVFSDEKGFLLERNGNRAFYNCEFMSQYFNEIKEPVKITVWKNVWQREDGSYFFGCDWPDEESAKGDSFGMVQMKYIKTVKFETEIEQ